MDIKQIPKTMLLVNDTSTQLRELNKRIAKANESYTYLLNAYDYETPKNLEEVTQQNLVFQIGKRLDAVERADYLSATEKANIRDRWLETRRDLSPHVKTIEELVTDYPEADFYSDGVQILSDYDLEEQLRKHNTKVVPEEASKHWELIQTVLSSVEALRLWEQEQDVRKTPLEVLTKYDPEELAERWTTGDIKEDHSFDHLETTKQRTALQHLYL